MITGGQYDVDVELLSPTKEIIYKQIKSQFDSHQFNAPVSQLKTIDYQSLICPFNEQETGVYAACFSNEFSTFSHKLIYMDFSLQDDQNPPLPVSTFPLKL